MAAIDPRQFRAVHKLFPQLTLTQSSDALMFSKGIPMAIIAEIRGISEDAVKNSLKAVRRKLGVTSTHAMITVIDVSVYLGMWSTLECVNESFEEIAMMFPVLEKINDRLDNIERIINVMN
ncbi:LuxR C-terminal-related transcriptional regulator [Sodalis endosymbiont of Spalangia cameroni]|uniref:helix-turn-helix transcriptional regulator n=1 Tax=Sodalis praecaptivus TaxID=1239307 RepID=UPI0031F98611